MNQELLSELISKIIASFSTVNSWTLEGDSLHPSIRHKSGIKITRRVPFKDEPRTAEKFWIEHDTCKTRIDLDLEDGTKIWTSANVLNLQDRRHQETIQWYLNRIEGAAQ